MPCLLTSHGTHQVSIKRKRTSYYVHFRDETTTYCFSSTGLGSGVPYRFRLRSFQRNGGAFLAVKCFLCCPSVSSRILITSVRALISFLRTNSCITRFICRFDRRGVSSTLPKIFHNSARVLDPCQGPEREGRKKRKETVVSFCNDIMSSYITLT